MIVMAHGIQFRFIIDFTDDEGVFFGLPTEKKIAVLDPPVCKFACMLSSAHVHMFAA
jgi:hypothetical protein